MPTLSTRGPLDPGVLLTAIPALLGFVPERSIIVIAFAADRSVSATMRHDLALDTGGAPTPEFLAVLAGLGDITRSYGAEEAVAVVVDDRFPTDDARYRRVQAIADRHFAAVGGIAVGFGLAEFDCGAPWSVTWCPDGQAWAVHVPGERAGHLDDPQSCPTAISEAVRSGRRILPRRAEMRTMLEPLDGECSAARPGPQCTDCPIAWVRTVRNPTPEFLDLDRTDLDRAGTSEHSESVVAMGAVMESVIGAGKQLDCGRVALLEHAILRLDVRDAALALAVTDLRDRAELLWRELTRRLTGRGRASAATLLAHLHYIGGEGAYAGAALDVALECDPHWKLASLLDTALRAGVRPTMLWEMIDDSYAVAAELGAHLPDATRRAAG
ncbi:DUF4192 domain-containing protein [Gordonia sp. zg691]|uniref:DUF4192 domain-containing protein n=1 Tax=Gordonia jinghuaiqii TaxID=2758710 RepID=A0A7D7QJX4_9ACTN|nr:DUF4192 domain-containing protein [Gordonia jinghuaiqii]MBD0861383.1 DUF4192 domain-containing protein [Gordonia jinghuaiqii]MCR5976283.1 DUF4192 family protein [Gordonia jinghuaiqii]QMT03504.1 DUF4192 domain-containing protein [Gordonia jinghuaiqii]